MCRRPEIASPADANPGRARSRPVCRYPVTRAETAFGFFAWTCSGPSPHFSIVPGRKFSRTTSADSHRRIAIAWPAGSRRLSVTERLLRARIDHHSEWSLWRRRPQSRIASPAPGASIFTTSAPKSPSSVPTYGPASSWPNSIARSPVSGPSPSAGMTRPARPSLPSLIVDHLREELDRPDDVHPHDRLGKSRLAALERVHDLAVAEERLLALGVVVPEGGAEPARDAGDRAQRRLEPRRAGGRDDDPVELLVERDLVLDRLVVSRAACLGLVADPVEARELVAADPRRRAAGGVRLDERADVVEVGEIGGVERADDRPAARLDVDEPLAREEDERLADGRARGAQALGERLGPQAGAGRQRAGEDRLAQLLLDPHGAGHRSLALGHFAYPTRAEPRKASVRRAGCMQSRRRSTLAVPCG